MFPAAAREAWNPRRAGKWQALVVAEASGPMRKPDSYPGDLQNPCAVLIPAPSRLAGRWDIIRAYVRPDVGSRAGFKREPGTGL